MKEPVYAKCWKIILLEIRSDTASQSGASSNIPFFSKLDDYLFASVSIWRAFLVCNQLEIHLMYTNALNCFEILRWKAP